MRKSVAIATAALLGAIGATSTYLYLTQPRRPKAPPPLHHPSHAQPSTGQGVRPIGKGG